MTFSIAMKSLLKIFIPLFMTLLFKGCGSDNQVNLKIDLELETHVKSFISTLKDNGVSIPFKNYREMRSVEISDTEDSHDYGICIIELNENRFADTVLLESAINRRVLIFKEKIIADFPHNYEQMLKLVVYHELIHCILEKEHDHSTDGIMATNVSDLLYLYPFTLDNLIESSLTPDYLKSLNMIGH